MNYSRAAKLLIPLMVAFVLAFEAPGQNLIINPGFESAAPGFTTDYTLWNGSPGWGANFYYVTNNPRNAQSSWLSMGDHTTGAGRMLLVDGSATAGRVFWRQTVNVTTNTIYSFSAWASKFDSLSPPILFFTVNGVQQGTFFVLPQSPSGWQPYGVIWNSGTTNKALLELRLQSTVGFGNNLALDDVAFRRASDLPRPTQSIEPAALVRWTSHAGISYQVQWATDADTNTWLNLRSPVLSTGVSTSITDPVAGNRRRYYRILQLD